MRRLIVVLAFAALALAAVPAASAAPAKADRSGHTASEAAALRTVACRGSAKRCRARVALGGGASNERVVIRLPDTDLRLVSVKPNRRWLRGAYLVSKGRFRLGGSVYVFRLNAVMSIPVGSYLYFTFRARPG